MNTIVRVGVDLAKRVIQVHAVDRSGKVVTNRALPRARFMVWCAQLPAASGMRGRDGGERWSAPLVSQTRARKTVGVDLVLTALIATDLIVSRTQC